MKFTGKFRHRAPSPPQSRLRRGRNQLDATAAFTLVEIMVALAIFSILVAAIYSTWAVIIRAKQVGTTAAALNLRGG